MKKLIKLYQEHLSNKAFAASILAAFLLLLLSLVINFYAGTFATEEASSTVTDMVLNHLPVFDVDGIFIYGPIVFWILLAGIVLAHPRQIPFTLKSISLFVLIRSLFISLTHLGYPAGHLVLPTLNILDKISFGGDLFFSGHTGLPFLLALIFWDYRFYRYLFLATSVLFAAVVLMGHLHYSIDVLGAYFITYTIFCICERFFSKDQLIFKSGLNV